MNERPTPKNAPIAFAADYADALLGLRRAKGFIELILFLMLAVQIGLFVAVKFGNVLPVESSATQPSVSTDALNYLTALSLTFGLILGILLPIVLVLIHHVMLVGRLIGLGKVTSALVWSFFLLLILFPWQTMLATSSLGRPDVVVPGVMFSWHEVSTQGNFSNGDGLETMIHWFRFVGAPVVAMIVLLIVRIGSGRGIRLALGETPLNPEMNEGTKV